MNILVFMYQVCKCLYMVIPLLLLLLLLLLQVSSECNEVPLLVIQYHFLGWPDHGVPKFATSLIEFIRRVRQSSVSEQPMLVHCGAGVGRTGTYITLDAMLERMKETDDINVYEFVRNMRAKRVLMVQTQVGINWDDTALALALPSLPRPNTCSSTTPWRS